MDRALTGAHDIIYIYSMCFENFIFKHLKKSLNSSDPRSLSHLAEPHVLFDLVRHHFGREAGGTAQWYGVHS